MNCFEYLEARLHENETFVARDHNIKLYDGHQKTQFEEGEVMLTTHRLFWGRPGDIARAAIVLCLSLRNVISISEESASSYLFGRKTRLLLHLRPPGPEKRPGPMDNSSSTFIKLSGKNGINTEFAGSLRATVEARVWEVPQSPTPGESGNVRGSPSRATDAETRLRMRTGIGGIERSIEAHAKKTDENIALAFQDLSVLMAMAKEMVNLSKNISTKIRSQKGEVVDDETVQFKSYLLSLGIDDPVTRDSFNSNIDYYSSLAKQICEMLLDPIDEAGGMMSLADVYCRVNRARGLELLSPEDLLNACHQLRGPITLRTYPSGAMVLQMDSQNDENIAAETLAKVEAAQSLAVEELAKQLGISLLLAKERCLTAERLGKVCRDDSVEGLRFYPNLFLLRRGQTDEGADDGET